MLEADEALLFHARKITGFILQQKKNIKEDTEFCERKFTRHNNLKV